MTKTFSKIALAAGAATLAFTPVAATAGTRAGDNAAVYTSAKSQPGVGRDAKGESVLGGLPIAQILFGLSFAAFTAFYINEAVIEDRETIDGFQSAGV
ncbi:MAG: hypothetical protein ABJ205_10450 [Erythrobacter sp.]|uniref:hypothetical protein n=1 Tax=Erythrobacter sp. TaxID=1042 RepID=UPI003265C2C0